VRRSWLLALAFGLALTSGASATTGTGCWTVVNVPSGDVLNLRAEASARSAILLRLSPSRYYIIAGGPSRSAAEGRCIPQSRPVGSRWCPVTVFDEGDAVRGWLKRRFIAPAECP
jgi:hypothetical protein